MDDGLALPMPGTIWVESAPTASASHSSPSHRRTRVNRSNLLLEPSSLTGVRTWLGVQPTDAFRPTNLRRTMNGVPFALRVSDVLALFVESVIIRSESVNALLFAATVLTCRATIRQYRQRLFLSVLDDVPRTLASTLAAVGLSLTVGSVIWGGPPPERELLQRAALFVTLSLLFEAVTFVAVRRERRRGGNGRRTLIVGAGRVGETVSEALLDYPELGLTPIGFLDPDHPTQAGQPSLPVVATDMSKLARAINDYEIDTTILAFSDGGDAHIDTVIAVHQAGCNLLIVPSLFELRHNGPDVEHVRGVPLLRLRPDPTMRPTWWIKRGLDISASALGLLVLSIPLAIFALVVLICSGRPILFWQERVGLDGRTFRLCKFRSLRPQSENESRTTWSIVDDPRLGRVGKFIRRSSIDEIPQLWNILRGQMSLVGPRPERPTFVQKFSEDHERYWARHRVPVGLTGLAQVNGLRGDTSIRERARYDNYYIANWSLWLDAKIVMLTVREVIGRRGR